MDWMLITVALAVLGVLILLLARLVGRFNQLSLAADLCREGRRQLSADLSDRHLLVPPLAEAARKRVGDVPEVTALGSALVSARRALEAGRPEAIGSAEETLTEAVESLAVVLHDELRRSEQGRLADPATEALEETGRYLYGQVIAIEGRIAAAVRYYNRNVDRYHERLALPLSTPFRGVFSPCERVCYTDLTLDPLATSEDAMRAIEEDYRPGRLSEEL